MRTQGIIKSLNIGKYVGLGHGTSGIVGQVNQLTFEATEEIFGHGVVIRVSPVGHALSNAVRIQAFTEGFGGVLDATVTVEDGALGRSATAVGHIQRCERELGVG